MVNEKNLVLDYQNEESESERLNRILDVVMSDLQGTFEDGHSGPLTATEAQYIADRINEYGHWFSKAIMNW